MCKTDTTVISLTSCFILNVKACLNNVHKCSELIYIFQCHTHLINIFYSKNIQTILEMILLYQNIKIVQDPKVVICDSEVCLRIHYFFGVSKFADIRDSFKHSQVEQIQIFPEVSAVISKFWDKKYFTDAKQNWFSLEKMHIKLDGQQHQFLFG